MHIVLNEINKLAFVLAPIFYKILYISLTGSLAGLFILFIRKLFDKKISPIWKYIMWAVVVISLIVPFRPQSKISVTKDISQIESISFRDDYDNIKNEIHIYEESQTDVEKLEQLESGRNILYFKSLTFDVVVPLVWFFGMIFVFMFLILNVIYLSHKVKNHTISKDRYQELLSECKNELNIKGNVQIVVQDYMKTPALIGFVKPKILLPEYVDDISDESLRYVVLHELAHLKRKDMFVNYILLVLQSVHWFNPFVWLLCKSVREDMEVLNDSYVIDVIGKEEKKGYSKSLVEVLGLSHNITLMPKLLCMTDGKKNVERRISMIKLNESFKKHKMSMSILCLLSIFLIGGLFLTQRTDDIDKNQKEMWENRTEYVGDNSKVGRIIYNQIYPKDVVAENFELKTNEKPYSIIINFETDENLINLYSQPANQKDFVKIAFNIFSLVGNVDNINFYLQGGKNYYNFSVDRKQYTEILGYEAFEKTEKIKDFKVVLDDISLKVDDVYEKMTEDTSIEDIVNSVKFENGNIYFTIPENFENIDSLNIIVAGRQEFPDGMSMSKHFFEEENSNHSWEKGKTYSIKVEEQNFTDLIMDISLPNGNTKTLDLLEITNNPINDLIQSINYKNGNIYFTIPENFENVEDWNIVISYRNESTDENSEDEYLFVKENVDNVWEKGKTYSVEVEGKKFKRFNMVVSLPNVNSQTVDLLNYIPDNK